uniref:Uncharacterized protein n=1 Tax=Setaria italica TaxID=4555 RepID=K4A030_SETIT
MVMPEWSNLPTSKEQVHVNEVLVKIANLKSRGLTAGAISINFSKRLIQPIKYQVHPAYEYSGPEESTREVQRKVPKEEINNRVSKFFGGIIRNRNCPKAYSLKWPSSNPRRPKIRPTDEQNVPPIDLQWEIDSSIGLDMGVTEEWPQPSEKRRMMAGKKKEKAASITTSTAMSASDADEESNTLSSTA